MGQASDVGVSLLLLPSFSLGTQVLSLLCAQWNLRESVEGLQLLSLNLVLICAACPLACLSSSQPMVKIKERQ